MNTKLLRRVQRQILKEPRQFQMGALYTNNIGDVEIPNCGTAACIAGWVNCLVTKKSPVEFELYFSGLDCTPAGALLGIDASEKNRLFWFTNWPKQFQKVTKEGTLAFARQAARRIDWFIRTKGAE